MIKYRYVKKYYSFSRDLTVFWRVLSLFLLVLGIFLIANTITPIVSYQLVLSPQLTQQSQLSPLASNFNLNSLSLAGRVLGEEFEKNDLTKIKNWFPEAPAPSLITSEIKEYYLSIPRLKIYDALVKVGNENLDKSLIHYPGTALPGKYGNAVVFGHSVLPQFFNPKNYLTIFSTLPTIKKGEEILVDFDQVRYRYLVEDLKEVPPNDIGILSQNYSDAHITLVTCVPPGTYLRRLVVIGKLSKS